MVYRFALISLKIVIFQLMRQNHKDRVTILSANVLNMLREYFKEYRPKKFLFEGGKGLSYSSTSVLAIIKKPQ